MRPLSSIEHIISGVESATEAWKDQHDWAMLGLDVEDALGVVFDLYHHLIKKDEALRDMYLEDPAEGTGERLQQLEAVFKRFGNVVSGILEQVRSLEELGYEVQRSGEIQRLHEGLEWMLAPANEAFNDPAFREIEREAIEAHKRGETLPMEFPSNESNEP